MPKPRITKEKIRAALIASKGLVYLAAKSVGCSARTVYNYLKKYPDLMEIADEQNGQMGDFAEGKLFKAIEKGEAWAIAFYLRTKHRRRGYVEKQELEHTGKDGGAIEIADARQSIESKLAGLAARAGSAKVSGQPEPE